MKFANRTLLATLFVEFVLVLPPGRAQANTQKLEATASNPEEKNLEAYVELLRKDVRQQKAEIMGSVMVLSAEDAAKFWPIYSEYDVELT